MFDFSFRFSPYSDFCLIIPSLFSIDKGCFPFSDAKKNRSFPLFALLGGKGRFSVLGFCYSVIPYERI